MANNIKCIKYINILCKTIYLFCFLSVSFTHLKDINENNALKSTNTYLDIIISNRTTIQHLF